MLRSMLRQSQNDFKYLVLWSLEEYIAERLRSRSGVVARETLGNIEQSRAARMAGDSERCRTLS